MNNTLVGLGMWIWELKACDGGDLDTIVRNLRDWGVSWVAVKCGETVSDGQVTRALVDRFKAENIVPAAWWYSRPGIAQTASQIAMLTKLIGDTGCTSLIMDAELEWESGVHHADAALFAQNLRKAIGPDVFLADAPWAIATAHTNFPWKEFGAVVDARMPQVYWELAKEPFATFAARTDKAWKTQPTYPPMCPIASMVSYDGKTHAPAFELGSFLDHYKDKSAVSVWSYQHLSAAERAVLRSRAAGPPTPPAAA